jgi:DNA polymerase elongation subunit (family B)
MTLKEKQQRIKDLKSLIEVKEKKLIETKKLADQYNAMQLALKIVLNGSYGAMANKHFVCFCNGVASSITAHGRDLIQYMESSNEDYWYNMFHDDVELHKEMIIFKKVLDYADFNGLDITSVVNDNKKIEEIKSKLNLEDIKVPTISKIDDSYIDVDTNTLVEKPAKSDIFVTGDVRRKEPVSAYCDTDSLFVSFKPALKKLNIKNYQLEYVQFISKGRMQKFFKEKLEQYLLFI